MENLLSRFSGGQRETIHRFFDKLAASTNKTGVMSESRKMRIVRSWEPFQTETVISALEVYIRMNIPRTERGKGKNENYVLGIIRNKAGEANAGEVVCGHGAENREDEGARLSALIGEHRATDGELDCDF